MSRVGRSAGVAVSAALALACLGPSPSARAAEPGIRQTAFVASELMDTRRHLDLDAGGRRLLEIGQRADESGMVVVVRDLDSLRAIGEVRITGAQSGAGGMLSTLDELRHRLYVLYPERVAEDTAVRDVLGAQNSARLTDEVVRVTFGIAVIDTLRLELLGRGSLALLQPAVPQDRAQSNLIGIKALSFARSGGRDLLYLASEVPVGVGNLVVSNHTVWLHQVDATRLIEPDDRSAVDWSYPVPQCGIVAAREGVGVVFRAASIPALAIACRQGGAQGLTNGQPLETPGVVRVMLRPGADDRDTSRFITEFHPISGNLQWGMVAVDPVAERLLVQVDGSSTEAAVWSFDVPSGSWLGLSALPSLFALGGTTGLAVDAALGRFYAISRPDPEGRALALLASTRAPTAEQGRLERFRPQPDTSRRRAIADPLTHRVFVSATGGYVVLRDTVPSQAVPADMDPDGHTIDVAEGEGTDVNFVGGAQAYGARLRWVGGTRGVERNINTTLENPPSDLSPNTGGILPPPPAEGTRDLHFARIAHTTLSNGESSARATGGERDPDNTDADLGGWTDYLRRWGGPDLSANRWPYPILGCADFGGAEDHRDARGYGAAVGCDRAGARTTALAVDESFSVGGALSYGQARARSGIIRDRARGVVSIAEAEVLGVQIGGVAGIGRIATRAQTWATGRPARSNGIGAGSSFIRTIEDVWVVRDGAREQLCSTSCDPRLVAEALNRALGLRARVELPEPEPSRAAGTPGGFEASIVRDPRERANEASINEEADARRLEVPGLVITVFADGRTPSRAVLSLAGVAAESHYGIFLVAQAVPFRPPSAAPPVVSGPGPVPGLPSFDDAPAPVPPAGAHTFLRRTFEGFRVALASPVRALRLAAFFGFLAAPLALLMRRRARFAERG